MDFYGTVAAGDARVVDQVCRAIVRDHGLALTPEELTRAWGDQFFATIEARNHDRFATLYQCERDSLVATLQPICGSVDPTVYIDQLTGYWCAPSLQPDAHEILGRLDLPVCCVSNADTDNLNAAIHKHGLQFDAVVTSEDVRCYKPNPDIFHHACRVMNVASEHVLHVGDSLHSDIAGAKNAGIDAAWVARDDRIYDIGQSFSLYKLSSLMDLCSIVSTLPPIS